MPELPWKPSAWHWMDKSESSASGYLGNKKMRRAVQYKDNIEDFSLSE